MIHNIAYSLVFGLPLIAWGGMVNLASFLFTAYISFSNKRGDHRIPFSWHPRMAIISLCLAIFHGLMGILSNVIK